MEHRSRECGKSMKVGKILVSLIVLFGWAGVHSEMAVAQEIESLLGAAEQGDVKAQCNLGLRYAIGEGVPEDDREAVRWYRAAAEQGNPLAQTLLGFMYARGEGVPMNNREALKWVRTAAKQGNSLVQFLLDLQQCPKDEGVPKDHPERETEKP